MPPMPKEPSTRQRRNKVAGARTLTAAPDAKAPALPEMEGGWHERTTAWWADVWASPMAPEYDDSDVHGLFLLAALVDEFWRKPSQALAAEIRLQRQCFGLSPIDRRRLQWEIDRGEAADDKTRKRRTQRRPQSTTSSRRSDPRSRLGA